MELGIIEILAGLTALFLAIYYYYASGLNFWSRRGVPNPKPLPLIGNFNPIIKGEFSIGGLVSELYKNYKDDPMFGIHAMGRQKPVLVVKDPEYIKDVLIKNFSTFSERGITVHEKIDPLLQHLFTLETARWRPLRNKLSPVFTYGKLKKIFCLLIECSKDFEDYLETYVKKNPIIECRELTAKFTTDVIGACAFGLKMNSLSDEDSEFRKYGRKIFEYSKIRTLKQRVKDICPWLYQLLGPLMYDYKMNNFFINSIKEIMDYRKKNNIKRNDFVDLLMEIQKNPSIVGDIEITNTLIAAQAFVFFAAGFETSSTTMSNALYEMAINSSIQDKLREEITDVCEENDGDLTYENIKSMKYLEKVFCETLRKYPPIMVLMRSAAEDYTFSGSKVTICKGTKVWIPAYAIQHDPQIYPDPETFDPERFDENNVKQRHPSFYLPFGGGPRSCIGFRFANYQSKIGLIKILKNYKVDTCAETRIPYEQDPKVFLLKPLGGIKLKFTKLNK